MVCVCAFGILLAGTQGNFIYNYKLGGTQGNGYNSVSGVSYWLEHRVMGITQCQGYPIG